MELQVIEDYINSKLSENEEYVRITFYDLRVKHNLTEEESNIFIELAKNKFENMGYKVYTTDDKYEYKQAKMTVQLNELMIAIKEVEEKENKNGRKDVKAKN